MPEPITPASFTSQREACELAELRRLRAKYPEAAA